MNSRSEAKVERSMAKNSASIRGVMELNDHVISQIQILFSSKYRTIRY